MGPNLAFLELAAQVIPTIFLALAVQQFFPSLQLAEAQQLRDERRRGRARAPNTTRLEDQLEDIVKALPYDEAKKQLETIESLIDAEIARRDSQADELMTDAGQRAGLVSLIVIFVMIVGEAAALVGLDEQEPSTARTLMAGLAIAAGGALLVYPMLLGQLARIAPGWSLNARLRVAWIVASAALLAAFAMALLT